MKFPQTELLDILSVSHLLIKKQWKKFLLNSCYLNFFFFFNLNSFHYFLLKKNLLLNILLRNTLKFTIVHSLIFKQVRVLRVTKTNKKKKQYSAHLQFKKKIPIFKRIKKKFNSFRFMKKFFSHSSRFLGYSKFLNRLMDINFLRKEKLYTKLKYSRVPQYDIVSGGSAALLAGFLGFLICEKFGFELLDSGDFYILFMYCVFIFFAIRLFLKLVNTTQNSKNILNFQFCYFYVQNVALFPIKMFSLIVLQHDFWKIQKIFI